MKSKLTLMKLRKYPVPAFYSPAFLNFSPLQYVAAFSSLAFSTLSFSAPAFHICTIGSCGMNFRTKSAKV